MPNTITPLPTTETLAETVNFKVTSNQKRILIETANMIKMDISDYCRTSILYDITKINRGNPASHGNPFHLYEVTPTAQQKPTAKQKPVFYGNLIIDALMSEEESAD